jgi:mannose-6-phosphate isomerase-like protein (cupin superfamily)
MNSNEINDIPSGKKVIKPWGFEYKIYSNDVSSTKLLNIRSGKKTSMHCHPIKKTGYIVLSGSVDVDLGFYETRKLNSISKLMIRPGLFHCTRNNSNDDSIILEIETPIDKDDLVRFQDEYGRENKPYEGTTEMEDLTKEDIVFHDPNLDTYKKYSLYKKEIQIEKVSKIKNIKFQNEREIFAVLGGGLCDKKKKFVLSPGDIVRTDTLKKLSVNFNTANFITIMRLTY